MAKTFAEMSVADLQSGLKAKEFSAEEVASTLL